MLRTAAGLALALMIAVCVGADKPAGPSLDARLFAAAERGDAKALVSLLAQGANVNARRADGSTPVIAAADGQQVEAVRVLIAAGADLELFDDRRRNAFHVAAVNGNTAILRMMIAAGANVHSLNRFNGTALIPACHYGHVENVRALLATAVDKNHVNRLGWTALLEAVILGDGGARHTEIVRLLVAAGADVNRPDHDGVRPLAHARNRGYAAIAKLLEAGGAR